MTMNIHYSRGRGIAEVWCQRSFVAVSFGSANMMSHDGLHGPTVTRSWAKINGFRFCFFLQFQKPREIEVLDDVNRTTPGETGKWTFNHVFMEKSLIQTWWFYPENGNRICPDDDFSRTPMFDCQMGSPRNVRFSQSAGNIACSI